LQVLDIYGTVPSTPVMDKRCFYTLAHSSTWPPSLLTYGSFSDWHEFLADQLLSLSQNAKYLSLVETLSVFWCFLSAASSDPSIGDSFLFWLLFFIVSVCGAATNWTSNNSAWSTSLRKKILFLILDPVELQPHVAGFFRWNWIIVECLHKNIDSCSVETPSLIQQNARILFITKIYDISKNFQ